MVQPAAFRAAPGVLAEGLYGILKGMVQGDAQSIVIHFFHLADEVRPVARPSLEYIVLPLVNHFVRQRADDFLLVLLAE
jgi:hypothetical protein